MNFLRPAIGHDVLARATLHKLGRRIAYASVDLTEDHDPNRLVAQATASYVLPEDSNSPGVGNEAV
jgi:acyl-coenzyme A thioesterase PaaI-like protein